MKNFLFSVVLFVTAPMSAAMADDATYTALHATEAPPAADSGRIYFFREFSIMGAAIQPDVYINGEQVWVARNGNYFYVDRPAGSYVVSTSEHDKDDEQTLPLAAGQLAYVRIQIEPGLLMGHGQATIFLPENAADRIKDCDFAPKDAVVPETAPATAAAPTNTTTTTPTSN